MLGESIKTGDTSTVEATDSRWVSTSKAIDLGEATDISTGNGLSTASGDSTEPYAIANRRLPFRVFARDR